MKTKTIFRTMEQSRTPTKSPSLLRSTTPTDNPGNLYYTWQISKGDPQKNDWTEIKDIPGNFNTASPSAGMGISQFSFTPKKSALSASSGVNYFKVTLTASKASDLTAGRGRSSVIIPVNTKGVKISLHKVDIKDGKAVVGDEICNDGLYKTLCPVVNGQMLAADVSGSHYKSSDSQFSWKVDDSSGLSAGERLPTFRRLEQYDYFFPDHKRRTGNRKYFRHRHLKRRAPARDRHRASQPWSIRPSSSNRETQL